MSLQLLLAAPQISNTTGGLQGQVLDSSGAPVASARISLAQSDTAERRETVTDPGGRFRLGGLPIGPWKLRAESPGFSAAEADEVLVSVGQVATLHIELKPGMVTEHLDVEEQAEALQETATSANVALGYERMEEAPAQGRNYLSFVLIAPGVAPAAGASTYRSPAANWNAANDSGFVFTGIRPRHNSITIDGSDNRDETTGATRVSVPLEMIQELRSASTAIGAENGGAAGGIVNIVTRSGSNAWHGHGEFVVMNDFFNARSPEVGLNRTPTVRRWQPGGSASGPLLRERTFLAFAAESLHENCEEWSETPAGFAAPGLTRGLFDAGERYGQASAKVQHILNRIHSLSARYAWSRGLVNNGVQGLENFSDRSARGSSRQVDHSFVAGLLSVPGPNIVNEMRLQVARRDSELTPNAAGPMMEIPGVITFGAAYRLDQQRVESHYEFSDQFSITHGRHALSLGANLHAIRFDGTLANRFHGLSLFSTQADYLANRPSLTIRAFGEPATRYSTTPLGLWLHDRWQPRPGLTIEAGLRYDRQWMPAGLPASNANFAPRFGLAWRPRERSPWVIRAGAGLFYDRYLLGFLNDAIQKDGVRAWESFNNSPLRAGYSVSSDFPTTYGAKLSAGAERQLGKDTTLTVEFNSVRGLHLPRQRNIATAVPQFLLENTARSRYEGATVFVNRRFRNEFTYLVTYTVGRTQDDASDYDEQPLDPLDTRKDWSRSRQHQLHRITASGLFELPFELCLAPMFSYGAGRPLNLLLPSDLYRTGAYPLTARPAGVARNSNRTPATAAVDLRFARHWDLGEGRRRLMAGIEGFNLFNRTNPLRLAPYQGAAYSQPIELLPARQFQFLLHYEF